MESVGWYRHSKCIWEAEMDSVSTTNSLFCVILVTGMILLVILLHNNIFLYRRKLSDNLSLMLLACVVMCAFELMWFFCDGHMELKALSYIGGCGYAVVFLAFGIILNRFFLEQFGITIQKKWLHVPLYVVPFIAFFALCATTPWTRLVFWVDEKGILQEMLLFHTLFYALLLAYLLSALAPAVYYAVSANSRGTVKGQVAKSLIIFGILAPLFYGLEILVVGVDSDYHALSLPCTVALVYLSTNVSTHLLLDTQAKMNVVENDLRMAAKIQIDALPPNVPEFPNHPDMVLRATMKTARQVGGDFYDYFSIDEHHLCFLIADVSGKSTPAALFMMNAKTMIKDYALTYDDTAEIFNIVNQRLCENNEEYMFVTVWIGILDMRTMMLQFSNAGHNYPLIKHDGEACVMLKDVHGMFLGGMGDNEYEKSEIQLRRGDRLLLYTDGVTEAINPDKKMYGIDRLSALLDQSDKDSPDEVLRKVLDDVNRFASGKPQFDDITLLMLEIGKQD